MRVAGVWLQVTRTGGAPTASSLRTMPVQWLNKTTPRMSSLSFFPRGELSPSPSVWVGGQGVALGGGAAVAPVLMGGGCLLAMQRTPWPRERSPQVQAGEGQVGGGVVLLWSEAPLAGRGACRGVGGWGKQDMQLAHIARVCMHPPSWRPVVVCEFQLGTFPSQPRCQGAPPREGPHRMGKCVGLWTHVAQPRRERLRPFPPFVWCKDAFSRILPQWEGG